MEFLNVNFIIDKILTYKPNASTKIPKNENTLNNLNRYTFYK